MKKAVLLIHGFAGGTYDLEELAIYLQIKDYDTFTFTLPGHDKRDKVTKEDWIKSTEDNLKKIIDAGYKNIYVVGHSMGGVLAGRLAAKHKEIKKLVLLAPAFRYITNETGKFDLMELIKKSPAIVQAYTGPAVLDRILKLHPLCLREFVHLIKENQKVLNDITCPTLIIHGVEDSIVPVSSSMNVYNKLRTNVKMLCVCDDATHHIFKYKNKDKVLKLINKFLSKKIYLKKKKFININ